jgi:DNA-binding NtrC family response regulator
VRALHQLSPRKDGPLVALNCAAIPKDLAENELFGHASGAFTGATKMRTGQLMAASGGTLLMDEIGEMDRQIQAKLLRVLETRTITPVGANSEQPIDVRIVAATHRDLRTLADEGKFREDLYYRLHVVHIDRPPLRQRREDIPLLVNTFLRRLNREHGRDVREVSPEAMGALQGHRWPGNVRELHNVLEGVVVLSRKEVIDLNDLPPDTHRSKASEAAPQLRPGLILVDLEREAIQQCLKRTEGNRQRSTWLLGISTRTLLRKFSEYELEDPLRPDAPVASAPAH